MKDESHLHTIEQAYPQKPIEQIDWTESYEKYPVQKPVPMDEDERACEGIDIPLLGPTITYTKALPGESAMDFVRFAEQFEDDEFDDDGQMIRDMFYGKIPLPPGKKTSLELWAEAHSADE